MLFVGLPMARDGPSAPKVRPRGPGRPQEAPKTTQEASKTLKMASKTVQEPSKTSSKKARKGQNGLQTAKMTFKMLTCSPKAFQTDSGNTWSDSLAGLASTFGRIGASRRAGGGDDSP